MDFTYSPHIHTLPCLKTIGSGENVFELLMRLYGLRTISGLFRTGILRAGLGGPRLNANLVLQCKQYRQGSHCAGFAA